MAYIETILFYNFILILSLILARKSSENKYGVIAIFVVFIVSACRYDIGNDYEVQYTIWDTVATLWKNDYPIYLILSQVKELSSLLFGFLFQGFSHPALYIFATYAFFFSYFLYKALKENDCTLTGIFALFTLLYLFYSWDWTRQAVAYAIGLYAVKFVRNGQFWNFIKFILLAFCFHVSALVLIFLYPLRYININKVMAIVLIIFCTALGYLGVYDEAASYIINNINLPFYDNYQGAAHSIQFVKMSSSITVLFKALVSIIILIYIPAGEKEIRNLVTVGTILYIISSQNLLIERVAYYFMISQIISLKYVFIGKKNNVKMIAGIVVVLMLFMFYNYAIVNVGGTRGAVPYDSVFSENCEKGIFRYRKFL